MVVILAALVCDIDWSGSFSTDCAGRTSAQSGSVARGCLAAGTGCDGDYRAGCDFSCGFSAFGWGSAFGWDCCCCCSFFDLPDHRGCDFELDSQAVVLPLVAEVEAQGWVDQVLGPSPWALAKVPPFFAKEPAPAEVATVLVVPTVA